MKIIAKTKTGFLVEATGNELANIMGFNYQNRDLAIACEELSEIKVGDAWNDLLRYRDAAKRITQAAETLRAVAQIAEQAAECYVVTKPETEAL